MKKKIFYLMALACCLGFYSSAKQVYKSTANDCNACKVATKKPALKAKKQKTASVRPFNFYLINI